jgi:3-carboxy-cis,cis-muconate cycloisomerase
VGAVLARACAQQAAASAEVLLRGMAQEHERAAGLWQAEWQALSGTLAYAGGAMAALAEVVEALEVRPERMRHNLVMTGGLLMAERVAQLLAPAVGKGEANDLIRRLSLQADVGFREALLSDRTVRAHLSIKEIDAALDPAGYLGATQAFIDRALAQYRALT